MAPVSSEEWWRRTAEVSVAVEHARPPRSADNSVAFWALMTFTFILLLAPQGMFPVLAPLRIALLAAVVAAGAHVVSHVAAGRPIIVLTREMKIAGCLLGWATVTIPFSYWPGGSVATLTDLFLKSLVLFWLIASTVTSVSRFQQFIWGLTLMSVPIAAAALINYRSGAFGAGAGERIVGYSSPLAANPNDLALTLNLIIPFTLALIWLTRRSVLRVVLLAILLLDVTAVVLTFSRAGFLTLAIIVAITMTRLLRSPKRTWGIAFLVALLLCLTLLPAPYWQRLATIGDIDSDPTGSAQARRDLLLGALQFVLTHPVVGAGIGAGVLGIRDQGGQTWYEVHNVYLQYAVDLGLPGLGLFVAFFGACLLSASTARHGLSRARGAQTAAHLAQGTWLSLIVFGVAGLFYPVAYHFYFYYLAGLAAACRSLSAQRARPEATRAAAHALGKVAG
jgi:O-antigen ligase